jgi:hypothetical protein
LLAQRVATVSTRFEAATVVDVVQEVEADGNSVAFAVGVDLGVDLSAAAA